MAKPLPEVPSIGLRLPQVIQRTGVKKATIYSLLRQDKFPKPRRVGRRGVVWMTEDIDEWLKGLPVATQSP